MKSRAPDGRSETPELDREEGLLGRWSRLKRGAASLPEAAAEPPADPATDAADVPASLTDADMPPLDSLGADSDYSPFLSPGVSDELRRLALRKLFSLPKFNLRDGLDDYDEDFRVFRPLGATVTADMKHRLERREEARREEARREEARREAEGESVAQREAGAEAEAGAPDATPEDPGARATDADADAGQPAQAPTAQTATARAPGRGAAQAETGGGEDEA